MTPHQRRELRRMRDAVAIANPEPLSVGLHPSYIRRVAGLAAIGALVRSDRRFFNPTERISPPAAFTPAAVRLVDRAAVLPPRQAARSLSRSVRPSSRLLRAPGLVGTRIGFAIPEKVAICVRRHARREVILALGKGGSRHRKPRRNAWSGIQC